MNQENSENSITKINKFSVFEDLNKSCYFLAQDVAMFLHEEVEDLNVSSNIFKSGLERCFNRVLTSLAKQTQQIVIFPDSIPGFTLMIYKKEVNITIENTDKKTRSPSQEIKESVVLNSVINRFFNKNQQKVILIETDDILFALFPVADTKKNLKDAGLFVSF